MKKFPDEFNSENTIVHVVMRENKNDDTAYECVGALMKEDEGNIRVAFNAKNDVVLDDLDIPKSDIISIDILDPATIVTM